MDIKLLVAAPNLALHADTFLLGRTVSKVGCGIPSHASAKCEA